MIEAERWRRNASAFSFLIPFPALGVGFLRVARYPPAASQIATAKTSVNAGRHKRTYRQEPGHKGGVGGALKEARHRRREDAPGNLRTSRASRCSAFSV